ncbi:Aminodeoxychorismate lyase [Providencia alcalifaciens]|uniref:aminodeoxychorismate lyase n=1 Tax=Providencia alcalifaciens TaxID=126385 RepID=UPI00044CD1EB|nr:aminodeoxychorismate lyase [Providencia alcalifaciens]EUD02149.1 aminodeoxychorismate lyase [Providencia alcalifaciens RIMD 1656011]CAG9422578.1 Aminodeoxychorismate lyase [Providencia alcalifaciens]
MTYWVNGISCQQIDITDRAIAFGDGCFTTIHGMNQQAKMLEQHILRLQQDSTRLKLPSVDWKQLTQHIEQVCEQQTDDEFVVKVMISRGAGGRGYSSQGFKQPTIMVMVSPFPKHYATLQCQGAALMLSRIPLSRNPILAGMKHLNRLEQVLIRQEIDDAKLDEAVVLDTHGVMVECCSANIFWRIGRDVYTPILERSGVNGLMRQKIIAKLKDSQYHLAEVERFPAILTQCDEVIICNALMPILPVKSIQLSENKTVRYQSRELFEYLLLQRQI